jgi:hypothetical protein
MDYDESRELSYRMQGDGQIWGSNMAFRREIFDDIGYLDTDLGRAGEKLYRGGEEQLFVNRALQHGRHMVYDPSLAVFHRIGSDRMRKSYLQRFFFQHGEGHARADQAAHDKRVLGAPPVGLNPVRPTARQLVRAHTSPPAGRVRTGVGLPVRMRKAMGRLEVPPVPSPLGIQGTPAGLDQCHLW